MRKQLLDQLHEVLRQQLFGAAPDLVSSSTTTAASAVAPAPASLAPAEVAARSAVTGFTSSLATGQSPLSQTKPMGRASDTHSQRAFSDPSSPVPSTAAGYAPSGYTVSAASAPTPPAAPPTTPTGRAAAAGRANQGDDEQWVGMDVDKDDVATATGSASNRQAPTAPQGADGTMSRRTTPKERLRFTDQQ